MNEFAKRAFQNEMRLGCRQLIETDGSTELPIHIDTGKKLFCDMCAVPREKLEDTVREVSRIAIDGSALCMDMAASSVTPDEAEAVLQKYFFLVYEETERYILAVKKSI